MAAFLLLQLLLLVVFAAEDEAAVEVEFAVEVESAVEVVFAVEVEAAVVVLFAVKVEAAVVVVFAVVDVAAAEVEDRTLSSRENLQGHSLPPRPRHRAKTTTTMNTLWTDRPTDRPGPMLVTFNYLAIRRLSFFSPRRTCAETTLAKQKGPPSK